MAVKGKKAGAPKKGKQAPLRQLKTLEVKEKPQPRQKRLPEMDDPAIEELEALAENYGAERTTQRNASKKQKELRQAIAKSMHNNGKQTYRHGGVFITLIDKGEEVRVKVNESSDEETKD